MLMYLDDARMTRNQNWTKKVEAKNLLESDDSYKCSHHKRLEANMFSL